MTLDEQIAETQRQINDIEDYATVHNEYPHFEAGYFRAVLKSLEQLKQLTQPITGGY